MSAIRISIPVNSEFGSLTLIPAESDKLKIQSPHESPCPSAQTLGQYPAWLARWVAGVQAHADYVVVSGGAREGVLPHVQGNTLRRKT